VEMIKFAIDWNLRTSQPGGKLWVGQFFTAAFQADPLYNEHFAALSEMEAAAKMKTLDRQYKQWKQTNAHIVTARNRLLKMYDTVSHILCLLRQPC
ncbi:uncharacterized protein LAESUDRAFT_656727, partial [Laetiporus sulphureus 93-53]